MLSGVFHYHRLAIDRVARQVCASGTRRLRRNVMEAGSELKSQIAGAPAGALFPIASPDALLAAFADGADATCEAGDVKLRAGDDGGVLTAADFQFTSAEQVADTILSRALV
jgi:hypothetical protein